MSIEKRAATYGVFTAVLALLAVFGVINADEQSAYATAGGEALSALVMLMAAVKTTRQRGEQKAVPPAE